MKQTTILSLITLILVCLSLSLGDVPFQQVWQDLWEQWQGTSPRWNPLLHERLPRVLVLFASGASLAVAGAVMQALFQNPLSAPNILGISSGGSLLALCVLIQGWHLTYPLATPIASFTGCLLALCIVYFAGRLLQTGPLAFVLVGISLSTLLIVVQSSLLYALRDRWELIMAVTEWEAGSSYDRTWQHVHMQLPATIVGLWGSYYYRKELNLLALGDGEASHLGVDVSVVRRRLLFCVALLVGGTLTAIGNVAFFGLLLPHVIRTIWGQDHRRTIPLNLWIGAIVLAFLDATLRFFSIQVVTIGNVSAILGALFFLLLLLQKDRQMHNAAW